MKEWREDRKALKREAKYKKMRDNKKQYKREEKRNGIFSK
jgi:hypothetical protein